MSEPPVRFSLNPYAAVYSEYKDNERAEYTYKVGMDLKYGISKSFTLDMMLIPDFGQIQSETTKFIADTFPNMEDKRYLI